MIWLYTVQQTEGAWGCSIFLMLRYLWTQNMQNNNTFGMLTHTIIKWKHNTYMHIYSIYVSHMLLLLLCKQFYNIFIHFDFIVVVMISFFACYFLYKYIIRRKTEFGGWIDSYNTEDEERESLLDFDGLWWGWGFDVVLCCSIVADVFSLDGTGKVISAQNDWTQLYLSICIR